MTQTFTLTLSPVWLAQEAGGGGMLTDSTPLQTQPGAGPDGTGGGAPPSSPFGNLFFIMIAVMIGFMILTSITAGRKEKKQRAEMLGALRKHDKVQTLGGVIGSVVEIKNDEVVLKVDEGSNTRIRFSKTAIQQVLRKNTRDAGPESDEAAGESAEYEPEESRVG